MSIKKAFKIKTRNTRYNIVKVLTPEMYSFFKENQDFISHIPRPFTLMLHDVFNDKPLKGLEIGFGIGDNTRNILDTLNIDKLFCVDPYIGKPYVDFNGISNFADGRDSKYSELKTKNNVEFIELTSDEAVSTIKEKLDFVYVDGVHSYEQCFRDLCNYYPLVKVGGFIGGHDFIRICEAEVIKAVFEFSINTVLVPTVVMPDFWFRRFTTSNIYETQPT